jgi:hypothetical protein
VSSAGYYEALEHVGTLDVDPHTVSKIHGAIQVVNENYGDILDNVLASEPSRQ